MHWHFLSIPEPVTLSEDVELKEEVVLMSPPASDSGSGSPHQFSPYCVDSEPGSPLLDHEQVRTGHTHTHTVWLWLSGLADCSVLVSANWLAQCVYVGQRKDSGSFKRLPILSFKVPLWRLEWDLFFFFWFFIPEAVVVLSVDKSFIAHYSHSLCFTVKAFSRWTPIS